MNKTIIYSLALMMAMIACSTESATFEQSPAERMAQHNRTLQAELCDAPWGWKVEYFPKTDSLLFSDLNKKIGEYDYEPEDMGVGGMLMLVQFKQDGTLTMLTDQDETRQTVARSGEYEIKHGMTTQLSFVTYNYLHSWVNDLFEASTDFFYIGKDWDGRLRFRTNNYVEPAREFIAFTPIRSQQQRDSLLLKSYRHRTLFEQMKNPQLLIKQGDRVFFRSDFFIKTSRRGEAMRNRRYAVFLFVKEPSISDGYPLAVNGLGSGYMGTEHGLSFRTGIRLNTQNVFCDFIYQDNKFVCELVRVYEPLTRTFRLVSKHLHPQGEPTGMVAEVYDQQ